MAYCLAMNIPHPRQIFRRITWAQFIDWVAWYDLQPWGDRREDARLFVRFWAALAPHVPDAGDPPSCVWPYIEAPAGLTYVEVSAQRQALLAYQEAMAHGV